VIGNGAFSISDADRASGSLPNQVKAAARRLHINLPDGWKAAVAIYLVSQWAEAVMNLSSDVLDRASALFFELRKRFE
jgi:hypothetical protein